MYLELKAAHVSCVVLSLALFLVRGLALLRDRRKTGRLWRILPQVVDSLLLACGIGLVLLLGLDPLRTPWLAVKLLCVLAYIVLGVLAFRMPAPWRTWCFAAAVALFGFIASVALTHDPRGIFSLLG
jgi:uncharacterized membrane protein SirB2